MCGLTGILNLNGAPAEPGVVRAMTDILAHRGPDDCGLYIDGPIGLGHQRLSIIDLTYAGAQPMKSDDGRFVIVYNGEVYNFRELRSELESAGHRFQSQTDTEVVLKAWIEWGEDALQRLNGMFAFAIWDGVEREIVLARDRYGIKPLYIAQAGKTFLFASEIKSLLRHPAMSAQLDQSGIVEYLTFQNFFTPRTLFRGVELLPAATLARLSLANGKLRQSQYWDWSFAQPDKNEKAGKQEYVEELHRLFAQAVERQLVSDVPVSSYLSGGIDSGAVSAVAASSIPYLRTFTVGFDLRSASGLELAFDERESAEYMSYLFKTEHYEMVLKAGDMERALPTMTYHLEEPRVGQSYPNFYAAKLAGGFGKVVLSGIGGDEIFGGYPWRYYRAVVNNDFEHYADKYYQYWQRLIPDDKRGALLAPLDSDARDLDTRAIFRSVFQSHDSELNRPEDYINHSLYFEAKTFLHGLLVVEDKLSMAHGLETRVPFLDNDLVDFAMRVPVERKLGNLGEVVRLNENEPGKKTRRYFERTRDGKLIMRNALEKFVPPEVSKAKKQGFSAPDASWFKGDSIDYVQRRVLTPDARIYELLDFDCAGKLLNEHIEGRSNRRLLIWSLLQLEQWLDTFQSDAMSKPVPSGYEESGNVGISGSGQVAAQ